MRFDTIVLPSVLFALCLGASAQSAPTAKRFGLDPSQNAVFEIGLDYTFFHANAPPGQCGCFSLNGGGGTLMVNAPHGISLLADLSAAHANNVDATTQNITLFNYLAGPRYSYETSHRLTPYAEVLAGGSTEHSNYTYVQDVSAFAASGGLGANIVVSKHIRWTILEGDYIYSRLPNNVNNRQNDLRLVSGIVFRFGSR